MPRLLRRPFLAAAVAAVGIAAVPVAVRAQADCDRACKVAAAQSYIDALATHDSSKVPFTDDVKRIENLGVTAMGATRLHRDLDQGAQYKIIKATRDERFIVEGDDVVVFYLSDIVPVPGGPQIATSPIAERFRIEGGKISQIEAVFGVSPGRTRQAWR